MQELDYGCDVQRQVYVPGVQKEEGLNARALEKNIVFV